MRAPPAGGEQGRGRAIGPAGEHGQPCEQLIVQVARHAPRGQHIICRRVLSGFGFGDDRPVKPQLGRQAVLAAESWPSATAGAASAPATGARLYGPCLPLLHL